MKTITGIYTIENLVNGKLYVGYAVDIKRRKREHKNTLALNKHHSKYLQNAYNKYGKENLRFEILEECEEQFLCSQEHYWCNMLNVHDRRYGYNDRPTVPKGTPRLSESHKINIGNGVRGERNGFYNKKHSVETRKAISVANIGKVRSEEFCKRRKEYMLSIKWKPNKQCIDKMKEVHGRRIIQMTLTGEYVKEFYTMRAAMDEMNLSYKNGHLVSCCKGDRLTCVGYSWMYKEDYEEIEKRKIRIEKLHNTSFKKKKQGTFVELPKKDYITPEVVEQVKSGMWFLDKR